MEIKHLERGGRGAFFIKADNKRVAEMTYSRVGDKNIIIDHTAVDDSLRGKHVGEDLLDSAAAFARANDLKVMATCPFALAQLKKNRKYADVFNA